MKITQSKSQASIEFILVIGILLLVLFVILFFSAKMQQDTTKVKENFERTKECFKIARLISAIYANGNGAEIRTKTDYVLKINNKSIAINDTECNFIAFIKNEANVTGKIVIKNEQNEVIVENY